MQIQRIQTLWLVLALGCMAAFIVLPFGTVTALVEGSDITRMFDLHTYDFIGLIIPAGLAALLLLIDVFSFRDLRFQKSVALLAMMMELVAIGITVYILCDRATTGSFEWRWATAFLGGAFVLTLLAIAGIAHDARILRNYDRIR